MARTSSRGERIAYGIATAITIGLFVAGIIILNVATFGGAAIVGGGLIIYGIFCLESPLLFLRAMCSPTEDSRVDGLSTTSSTSETISRLNTSETISLLDVAPTTVKQTEVPSEPSMFDNLISKISNFFGATFAPTHSREDEYGAKAEQERLLALNK